jgi:hypothetical protein
MTSRRRRKCCCSHLPLKSEGAVTSEPIIAGIITVEYVYLIKIDFESDEPLCVCATYFFQVLLICNTDVSWGMLSIDGESK